MHSALPLSGSGTGGPQQPFAAEQPLLRVPDVVQRDFAFLVATFYMPALCQQGAEGQATGLLIQIGLQPDHGVKFTQQPLQALRRLEWESLVVILPRRGTLVADLNESDLGRIYEMRSVLEPQAAGLAAERGTEAQRSALADVIARMHAEQIGRAHV